MSARTIYVIDDHQSVRDALRELLSVLGFVVETFESADSFLRNEAVKSSGCVVADVRMPGTDGIELVRQLGNRKIALPVVLISGHADIPMAVAAIKAGADEFIEKPLDDVQLVRAINRALDRSSEEQALRRYRSAVEENFHRLTPRQVEVFDLVTQGLTSQAVAQRLDISVRTVESYRAEVMDKMQADSIATLVRQAVRLGRITP